MRLQVLPLPHDHRGHPQFALVVDDADSVTRADREYVGLLTDQAEYLGAAGLLTFAETVEVVPPAEDVDRTVAGALNRVADDVRAAR